MEHTLKCLFGEQSVTKVVGLYGTQNDAEAAAAQARALQGMLPTQVRLLGPQDAKVSHREFFGRTLRVLHGSPAAYVKFRTGKESIPSAGEAVLEAAPPRVLKKIELLEQGLKTAQVMATLRSEAVDETVLFELAVEKRAWRILAVRDAGRKSATAPSGAAGIKLQPSAQGEGRTVEVVQDDPAKQTSAPRFTLEDARLAGQKDSVKKEIRQTLLQAFQSGRLTEAQYRERLKKLDDLSS